MNILLTSADEKKLRYQEISSSFDKLMKALFRQHGAHLDINILSSNEAMDFIQEHTDILDSSFEKVEMTDKMRERLTRSNYIFSGMKTFHELNEAFPSLLDENGDRKPFERFLNDVRKINETYNRNYLRAEYGFVQSSATMAAKWERFAEDGDENYLQYRTAHDDKVRPEHAALDRVTLPMSDPFWESYYPPNGWNCRCTVVQVLKWKYDATPHGEAMDRGKEALDGERFNIFRFNSGKQGKAVPDYNPYTIKKCNSCDVAKGKNVNLALPDNQLCEACRRLHKCAMNTEASRLCTEKKGYIKESTNFTKSSKSLQTGKYFQTRDSLELGLKHARTIEEINAFKWIASHLDQLSFIRFSPLGEVKDMTSEKDIKNVEKKRKRGATGYNEYEIHIDGKVWKLKTEIRKNSRETLYIAFKKK